MIGSLMSHLRKAAVRLAYDNPELRASLLPLLREGVGKVATDFPNQAALKKYLRQHPNADKSKHRVVEDIHSEVKSESPKKLFRSDPGRYMSDHVLSSIKQTTLNDFLRFEGVTVGAPSHDSQKNELVFTAKPKGADSIDSIATVKISYRDGNAFVEVTGKDVHSKDFFDNEVNLTGNPKKDQSSVRSTIISLLKDSLPKNQKNRGD
jgi:hypothetical protein